MSEKGKDKDGGSLSLEPRPRHVLAWVALPVVRDDYDGKQQTVFNGIFITLN